MSAIDPSITRPNESPPSSLKVPELLWKSSLTYAVRLRSKYKSIASELRRMISIWLTHQKSQLLKGKTSFYISLVRVKFCIILLPNFWSVEASGFSWKSTQILGPYGKLSFPVWISQSLPSHSKYWHLKLQVLHNPSIISVYWCAPHNSILAPLVVPLEQWETRNIFYPGYYLFKKILR